MDTEDFTQVGIADLPNQRHRIVSRNGTSFTILLCGESGLGKTTFCNTLFSTTLKLPRDASKRFEKQLHKNVEIEVSRAELEEKNFHMRLTVIDTPGYGDYINNSGCWESVLEFIEDQYESYMRRDQQPDRRNIVDARIHACLYFLRPYCKGIKPLDLEAIKQLSKRVNLIPVIAKADVYSRSDLALYKSRIKQVLDANDITIFKPILDDDDPVISRQAQAIISAMPFAVVGSQGNIEMPDGRIVRGRKYPWGVVDLENEDIAISNQLRNYYFVTACLTLFKQLRITFTKLIVENKWRLVKEEEQLRRKFTEQVRAEEARFRQWEQRLIAERDRLNKDLEAQHFFIKQLEHEIERIQTASSLRKR
ncbi:septin Spn4 [Schizosaccharomyces japonicus yFS275]|uniref:Septin Spn4 n=1 Tax=Schizosaccharomyces japonicus (strain yFS275 / FY16936) TaxID=402676 RepID=B6K425_SCHJY|nr:septin Spn4 [Schizosaccharomyces japonicus yFS275]EEB08232.1 septin Spn4 [Schizosaccharomyces japonicus yFS275]